MARVKGTANLAASLEVLAGAPLDARTKVPLKADLTASGTFPYPYEGMTVYVVEEKKSYTLIGADPTVSANWQEAGSESGQTIQVDELPTASADELGKVYQYIGETDTDYTHGFFYECVEGETAGTYEWAQTDTQPELEELSATDVQDIKDEFNPVNVPVISGAMNYSTDEQIVGTWVDGKTVYQKTIVANISTYTDNNKERDFVYNLTDVLPSVDTYISFEKMGYLYKSGGYYVIFSDEALTTTSSSSDLPLMTIRGLSFVKVLTATSSQFLMKLATRVSDAYTSAKIIGTFRYTKTTD